jgi:hypothetical protein
MPQGRRTFYAAAWKGPQWANQPRSSSD